MGLKFTDQEEHDSVRKLTFTILALVVLSGFLFFVHMAYNGNFLWTLLHLIMSLVLPVLGYFAVQQSSMRLMYLFHLLNIQYAVLHTLAALLMYTLLSQLEISDPVDICGGGEADSVIEACVARVREKQRDLPMLYFWWCILTTPMWLVQVYAAYQAFEYYFRLRIKTIFARQGNPNDRFAVVTEGNLEGEE